MPLTPFTTLSSLLTMGRPWRGLLPLPGPALLPPDLQALLGLAAVPAVTGVLTPWQQAAAHAATLAQGSGAYAPVVLVDFLAFGRTFSTAPVTWSTPELLLAPLSQGGMGALTRDLDEVTNAVHLGGTQVTLLNAEDLARTFDTGQLAQSAVRVRLGFPTLAEADYLTLFTGVVDRYEVTRAGLTCSLVDASVKASVNLSVPVAPPYFPGAPQASRSQHIPILLGATVDAPTIPVSGAAVASLAFGLASTQTACYLLEYSAPFPATGTVTIGTETAVTYTGTDLINVQGATYRRLSGLTRGSPVSQAEGTVVTLTSVAYQYLLGYEVEALNRVRDDGVLVDPADYTLSTQQADRAVSVLTFAAPRGTVTVDINAANIDLTNLLTNGGFETGDLTGWTLGDGATGTVETGDPLPAEGTEALALTGGLDVYGAVWQEVTTIPNALYRVSLVYRNAQATLVPNGSFETGDLTGWTLTTTVGTGEALLLQQGLPTGDLIPVGGWGGGGAHAVVIYTGAAADGTYYVGLQGTTGTVWAMELTTTFPTIPGATYIVQCAYASYRVAATLAGIPLSSFSQAGLRLTSADDATVYLPTTQFFNPVVGLSGLLGHPVTPWIWSPRFPFEAVSPEARVTLLASGTQSQFHFLPTLFDSVLVQTAEDTSRAALQLGPPDVAGQYADVELPAVYAWTAAPRTFRALTTTTRVTLRSRYAGTVLASAFDAVSLQRAFGAAGGENPVEAIAYLLTTFLPQCTYDADNFAEVYAQRLAWRCGTVLTQPGDSRALLERLAQQCACLLLQNAEGVYRLVPLDGEREPVWTLTPANLVGSVTRVPEPIDAIYTALYVWFGAKTGGSTSQADFAGVTYATPAATTHPVGPELPARCAAALALYGREHRLDVYADFLQDFDTANLLLAALVERWTRQQDRLTLTTWLDAAGVRLGDVVRVEHPVLAHGAPHEGEVVGWHYQPGSMTVELVVRTLRLVPPPPPVAGHLQVAGEGPAPLCTAITALATPGIGAALDPTSLDLDPDTPGQQRTWAVAGQGTFTATLDGEICFTAAAGWEEEVGVRFTVRDTCGQTSTVGELGATMTAAPVDWVWVEDGLSVDALTAFEVFTFDLASRILTNPALPLPDDATFDLTTLTLEALDFPARNVRLTVGASDGVLTVTSLTEPAEAYVAGWSETVYFCTDTLARTWHGRFVVTITDAG
jgi:hypothetical protein